MDSVHRHIKTPSYTHMEKAVAPLSTAPAWRITGTREPGGLRSMGSLRVGHAWATSLSLFTFMHWRRQWHPAPVPSSGGSQGRGSLVGCRLRGHTGSDTAERLSSSSLSHTHTHTPTYRPKRDKVTQTMSP